MIFLGTDSRVWNKGMSQHSEVFFLKNQKNESVREVNLQRRVNRNQELDFRTDYLAYFGGIHIAQLNRHLEMGKGGTEERGGY